jgi:hypothetical protein
MDVEVVCILAIYGVPITVMLFVRGKQEADPGNPGLNGTDQEPPSFGWNGLFFGRKRGPNLED